MHTENPSTEPEAETREPRRSTNALRIPAIGLLITSVIVILWALRSAFVVSEMIAVNPNIPDIQRSQLQTGLWIHLGVVIGLALLQATGALLLLTRRQRWLAAFACVTALVPCGYYITIPFGLWALVVLYRKEVWDSFRS